MLLFLTLVGAVFILKTFFQYKVASAQEVSQHREEKSLRHVAMVAKCLDKRHLKSEFVLFQTS